MGDRYTIIMQMYEPASYYDSGNWLDDVAVLERLNEQNAKLTTLRQQLAAAEAKVKAESDAAYMLSIMVKERDAQLAAAEARGRGLRDALNTIPQKIIELSAFTDAKHHAKFRQLAAVLRRYAIDPALAAAPEAGETT